MSLYSWALRPALFALDPERAHDTIMAALQQPLVVTGLQSSCAVPADGRLQQRVLGLQFDNPLGLAAGLDKQGTAAAAWAAIGFGHAEIGTVTPLPQPGNPRPRMFRLPADQALINRLGFNSIGASGVAANLAAGAGAATRASIRIGVNVGKNKTTPNDRAVDDYIRAVDALHPHADYFTVNVSSPNTPGLRALQEATTLRALIEQVVAHVRRVAVEEIPVLVKFSPDAALRELLGSVDAALAGGASGIIATNTTTEREGLRSPAAVIAQAGGLSGAPLRDLANLTCQHLFRHVGRHVPIVGVGGIFNADHAYDRIRSGATLVQMYTGLIYEGPGAVGQTLRGVAERLEHDGFSNVADAIGADVA